MLKSRIITISKILIAFLLLICITTTAVWYPNESLDAIRRYSRSFEFDYVGWEISAIWQKAIDLSFGVSHYLNNYQHRQIIEDYFRFLSQSRKFEQQILEAYSNPNEISQTEITSLENNLNLITRRLNHQTVLAEAVFQYQISQAIAEMRITNFASPFPPVLLKTTSLPKQLIISPRNMIRQEKSISIREDITLKEMVELEEIIEENTDYSALVVPIGGVGTYPSMIIQTTYLPNLLDTSAHEWTHNFLVFRPLGIRYGTSPALRTMNETTANIAGGEIMQTVLKLYYPEYIHISPILSQDLQALATNDVVEMDEVFIFSKEMYLTRNQVDKLLVEGKIEEAEIYMEERRLVFWENGYQIRKINQAYFSFYGAYADSPYSAAGRDPVGENVRLFRSRQPDLRSFIRKISWMYNYHQLILAARAF